MLGPRIAALRRQANMSQSELAQRLKVSPSAVGMYEQGRREPALETLVDMSRIFGVSLDYLATGQCCGEDRQTLQKLLEDRIQAGDKGTKNRHFTRQELAVLFAAMLME